jgi:copper(I)-binding protein
MKPLFLALLLALLAFSAVGAQDEAPAYDTHGLLISNVWVRPTAGELAEGATPESPIPGTTTGAYMTIHNTSETAYQLVGIETDAAEMTHVHETTLEGDVARMRMIRAVDIPAGETVALAPLGFHAMLMNATRDVRPGEAVALTLTFADPNGDTFDVPVAALATDFPTEEVVLTLANPVAVLAEDGTLDVALNLENAGDAVESLTAVSSVPASTALLLQINDGETMPYTSVDVLPQQTTTFSLEGTFVRLSDVAAEPGSAFTLTLEFASGKMLTVAVPVIGAAS